MDSYFVIDSIPSRMIPYRKGTVIRIRPFTFGEVMYLADHRDNPLEIMDMFDRGRVIEGVPFKELTVGDYTFLMLTVVTASFASVTYTLVTECPKCLGKIDEIDLYVVGSPKLKVEGKLKSTIMPADIGFRALR